MKGKKVNVPLLKRYNMQDCISIILIINSYKIEQLEIKLPSTFFAATEGFTLPVEGTFSLVEKSFARRSSVIFICSFAAISNSTIGLFGYRFCKEEK